MLYLVTKQFQRYINETGLFLKGLFTFFNDRYKLSPLAGIYNKLFKQPDVFHRRFIRACPRQLHHVDKGDCFFVSEPPPPPPPQPSSPLGAKGGAGMAVCIIARGRGVCFSGSAMFGMQLRPLRLLPLRLPPQALRNYCAHAKSTATIWVINRFPAATPPSGSRQKAPPAVFEAFCQARLVRPALTSSTPSRK